MAPIGNIRLPEVIENTFFAPHPSSGNPHPTDPMAAEKGDAAEARTRAEIERILSRRPPTQEEADALQRAAQEFRRHAMEERRRLWWRRLWWRQWGVCIAVVVVGLGVWGVWCVYR